MGGERGRENEGEGDAYWVFPDTIWRESHRTLLVSRYKFHKKCGSRKGFLPSAMKLGRTREIRLKPSSASRTT